MKIQVKKEKGLPKKTMISKNTRAQDPWCEEEGSDENAENPELKVGSGLRTPVAPKSAKASARVLPRWPVWLSMWSQVRTRSGKDPNRLLSARRAR